MSLTGTQEWEGLTFTNGDTFKEAEEAFGDAEAAGGRHTVLKRFNKFVVVHLCLFIPRFAQFCLFCKTLRLVNRVIELTVPVPQLTPGNNRLETFRNVWVCRV